MSTPNKDGTYTRFRLNADEYEVLIGLVRPNIMGGFQAALVHAIEKADIDNRERIFSAFPHYAAPVSLMQNYGTKRLLDALPREDN